MVKDVTREKLLRLKKQYGTKVAIEVASKSLRLKSNDGAFKKQYNGEICEVVLEMILLDFIQKQHPDWFYIKGMILPDIKSNNREFLTEIDFVLFTPQCIYCIECKSYAGNKRVEDSGTIVLEDGTRRDVYRQNSLHLNVLNNMLGKFSKNPKYKMLLFNFSRGNIQDIRDENAKLNFPVVDEKSVVSWLDDKGRAVWNMRGLSIAKTKLERYSDVNRERHLKYVQGLYNSAEDI